MRRRPVAIVAGALLVVPAAWLELTGRWRVVVDGLSLVLGATGAAILWTGLTGALPDWIDGTER